MAKSTNIYSVQNVNNLKGSLNNALGANTLTAALWTAGNNDAVLKSWGVTSTDTADAILQIWINVGGSGTDLLAGSVLIPAGSGTDGVKPAVDVLGSALLPWLTYDAYGNTIFNAVAGTTIKASVTVAVTSGKLISCIGDGGDL